MTRDEMDAMIGAATVSATDLDGFIDEARDLRVAFIAGMRAAAGMVEDAIGAGYGTAGVTAAVRAAADELAKTA